MQDLSKSETHVLVVDDDDRIRDLLKRYLSRAGYRVSAARSASHARSLMNTLDFDLLVLDVMMPGEDGFSFTKWLRQRQDIPIILLTARGEPADRIEGLSRGADDYLAKPFEPEELTLRIENILRRIRKTPVAEAVCFGPWAFDLKTLELTKDGSRVKLTTGETELLEALARNGGEPVSRLALAGTDGSGSERSVDVQVTRLRRKLGDDSKEPAWLQTVRGRGYRLLAEPVGLE